MIQRYSSGHPELVILNTFTIHITYFDITQWAETGDQAAIDFFGEYNI